MDTDRTSEEGTGSSRDLDGQISEQMARYEKLLIETEKIVLETQRAEENYAWWQQLIDAGTLSEADKPVIRDLIEIYQSNHDTRLEDINIFERSRVLDMSIAQYAASLEKVMAITREKNGR